MKTSEQLRIRKPSVHSLLRRTGFYWLTYFIGVQRSNSAFRDWFLPNEMLYAAAARWCSSAAAASAGLDGVQTSDGSASASSGR